jgi:hypothetical protein
MQMRNQVVRIGLAVWGVVAMALPAVATGPNNQVVPNPAVDANLNSVVQMSFLNGGNNQTLGTGSIIDKFTVRGVGYFCVLTADHVIAGGATRISFQNGNGVPLTTFPIDYSLRFIGANGVDRPDMALSLVRFGAPNAAFNNVVNLSLINGAAIAQGAGISVVGFGNTGAINPVTNVLSVQAGTAGTKRYQNNLVSARPAIIDGIYRYQGVEAQYNVPGVAGEGGTFGGDSGAPYFSSSTTFDPDDGGPLPALRNNTIAAVHTLGVNVYNNGTPHAGVDVFTYRQAIVDTCNLYQSTLVASPEPTSVSLLVITSVVGVVLRRRKR